MARESYDVVPVGWVESPLVDPARAPRQGDEGAPRASIVFDARVAEAWCDLEIGADVLVLTWLHRARRDILRTRPRGDPANPELGVFSTRSPERPNPIGVHRVRIVGIEESCLVVEDLEAVDGTPVIDVKPVLGRER
jgi:tRNA-Thr(GGU) m(6)t(6)A37 methyltransferase TsaA